MIRSSYLCNSRESQSGFVKIHKIHKPKNAFFAAIRSYWIGLSDFMTHLGPKSTSELTSPPPGRKISLLVSTNTRYCSNTRLSSNRHFDYFTYFNQVHPCMGLRSTKILKVYPPEEEKKWFTYEYMGGLRVPGLANPKEHCPQPCKG